MKKILLGAIVLGVLIATVYGLHRHNKRKNGYCFEKNRYLTDHEITDIAVTRLLENLKVEFSKMSPEQQSNTIFYEDLRTFYKAQPRCCGHSRDNSKSERPNKPRFVNGSAHFTKTIIYKRDKTGEKKFRGATFGVPVCGDRAFLTSSTDRTRFSTGRPTDYDPVRSKGKDRRLEVRENGSK